MEEWKEFSAKTADEALTNALIQMETTSDQIEYEVVEEEKSGILGLFFNKSFTSSNDNLGTGSGPATRPMRPCRQYCL